MIVAAAAMTLAGCSAERLVGAQPGHEVQSTTAPAATPDAAETDGSVRLEVWSPTREVSPRGVVEVTGRATNISAHDVWYPDKPCSTPMIGWVRFPAFDDVGRLWPDARERFKRSWTRGSALPSERYLTVANAPLHRTTARGDTCNPDRSSPTLTKLAPGEAITFHTAQRAEWTIGRTLPSGAATVGMLFLYGASGRYNAMTERALYASVPARVSGGSPIVPPSRAVDAALALPEAQRYAAAHARETQLSLNARIDRGQWVVTMGAIDVSGATKAVAPQLVVRVDAATGRVAPD